MAREPRGISLTDGSSEEYIDFRRRLAARVLLTVTLATWRWAVTSRPELCHHIRILIVDKTGALTEGRPALVAVVARGMDQRDLLRDVSTLEAQSERPLFPPHRGRPKDRRVDPGTVTNIGSVAGKGVTDQVDGRRVATGNRAMIEAEGADAFPLASAAHTARTQWKSAIFVAQDDNRGGNRGALR